MPSDWRVPVAASLKQTNMNDLDGITTTRGGPKPMRDVLRSMFDYGLHFYAVPFFGAAGLFAAVFISCDLPWWAGALAGASITPFALLFWGGYFTLKRWAYGSQPPLS